MVFDVLAQELFKKRNALGGVCSTYPRFAGRRGLLVN